MSQTYNDHIKRPKPQDTQLEILEIMHFAEKFSRGLRVQKRARESDAGVSSISL